MLTRATDAIDASASPLNPSVPILSRSVDSLILLVAWRINAVLTSSASIPLPLSVTRIYSIPPPVVSTVTDLLIASIAFSTSSFTTDAGRSITSPAAIWLETSVDKTFIFFTVHPS